jgi:hypothetical protein
MTHMNGFTKALTGLVLLAASCLAGAAGANGDASKGTVRLVPATIGTGLQTALHDRYGDAEGAVLQSMVADSLGREFKSAGATLDDSAGVRIEVSIEDATPTHPTRHQLELNPSLDPVRSVSLGGARLHAVLRSADGKEVDHVDYDYRPVSLEQVSPSGDAWADARVTIQRFSDLVVKAWRHQSSGG